MAVTETNTPRRDLQEAQHVLDPILRSHPGEGDKATPSAISSAEAREGDERFTNDVEGPATVPCPDPSSSNMEEAQDFPTVSTVAEVQSFRIPRSVAEERFEDQPYVLAKSVLGELTTEATNTKQPTSDKITQGFDTVVSMPLGAFKSVESSTQHSLDSNPSRATEYAPKQLGINCYWRGAKHGFTELFPCTNIAKGTYIGDPSRYQGNGELNMTRNADGTKEDLFRGRRAKGDENKQDAEKAKVCGIVGIGPWIMARLMGSHGERPEMVVGFRARPARNLTSQVQSILVRLTPHRPCRFRS